MMTSAQCLAKAARMDALSLRSDLEGGREAYAVLARDWRRMAATALEQEAWAALHPN